MAAGYTDDEVELVADSAMDSFVAEGYSVADWNIVGLGLEPGVYRPHAALEFPVLTYRFEGGRISTSYVIKIIMPLIMIIMMSWVVFYIDPSAPSALGVSVTSVLTLVAYHVSLASRLPQIPYLTDLDVFLYGSTCLVFLSLMEVVVTSSLVHHDKLEKAQRLDICARIGFPIGLVAVAVYSFVVRQ